MPISLALLLALSNFEFIRIMSKRFYIFLLMRLDLAIKIGDKEIQLNLWTFLKDKIIENQDHQKYDKD